MVTDCLYYSEPHSKGRLPHPEPRARKIVKTTGLLMSYHHEAQPYSKWIIWTRDTQSQVVS